MADVILTIAVPDAMVTRTLNAFNAIADTHITIEARGSQDMPDGSDSNGHWDFRITPKAAEETHKQFGERVLRELGKAVINMVDKAEDDVRYKTEVAAIALPASDVPDNILT